MQYVLATIGGTIGMTLGFFFYWSNGAVRQRFRANPEGWLEWFQAHMEEQLKDPVVKERQSTAMLVGAAVGAGAATAAAFLLM